MYIVEDLCALNFLFVNLLKIFVFVRVLCFLIGFMDLFFGFNLLQVLV